MKCLILNHEWKEAENGNIYCQTTVKEDGDEWAQSFKYNFFCSEEVKESMEAKFPKYIHLKEVSVEAPSKFQRTWLTDSASHVAGEVVGRTVNGEFVPITFDSIKVVLRTLPNGDIARGEDAERMMMRTWNRGIADGSIIPMDDVMDEDPFDGTESTIDEPEVVDNPPVVQARVGNAPNPRIPGRK